MIFAVPILIAVALFLLWALVKLTLNALPLFVGATLGFLWLAHGQSPLVALLAGGLSAIAVTVVGAWAFAHSQWPAVRLFVGLAFAGPAAIAAYHAVRGLAVVIVTDGPSLTCVALVAAAFTGWLAWVGIAEKGQRQVARTSHIG